MVKTEAFQGTRNRCKWFQFLKICISFEVVVSIPGYDCRQFDQVCNRCDFHELSYKRCTGCIKNWTESERLVSTHKVVM